MTAPGNFTHDAAVAMALLGVDWGGRRIGLAFKPAGQDWALPRGILAYVEEQDSIAGLRKVISDSGAQGVVVGLPLNQDPAMANRVKRFCRRAREGVTGVRWFFIDENLTSQEADSISLDKGHRRPTDDIAAKLIVETFIQQCR
jgi:RNase H-fold protein (predicted Holliday junction resolvase)